MENDVISAGQRTTAEATKTPYPLLKNFPKLAALITLTMGVIVLIGWAFVIPLLKSVLPGAVEMKANTAIGLILSALALWLLNDAPSRKQILWGQTLAFFVTALGVATLGEYLFGWRLGIDELLFLDTADAFNRIPGRMSPYSTVVFTLTGIALLALPIRTLRPLMWVTAITVIAIGMISFLGYLWNASELVTDRVLPPVAVNTAIAFILIGLGILRAGWTSHRIQRTSMELKIIASFLGTFIVLVLMGGFTYRTGVAYEQSAKLVGYTQIIRSRLGELYGTISDIESRQRSYLLTGKAKYKSEYQSDITQFYVDRDKLERLVEDHSEQIHNLAALWPLIDHRIGLLERHRAIFESEGLRAASKAIADDDGNKTMRQIRQLTNQMDRVELDLLAEREAAMTQKRQITLIALLATLAVATLILGLLFVGIRREILARAKAEAKAQSSATRIRTILDTVVDGIITVNNKGMIETFNPAAERIFGYSAQEAIGQNLTLFISRHANDSPGAMPRELIAAGNSSTDGSEQEFVGRRKDETEFPMTFSVSEMVIGNERHFTGIIQDITTRKRAEQVLIEAKERAELANLAKDSFLATMSHEIRTPLTGMLGMLELLSLSGLNDQQKSTLNVAWESGRNLLRIVSDILDWSKIQAGKLQLVPRPVSLPQLLLDVVNTYSRVASTKNLILWQHLDHHIAPAHVVDPLRLSQILNNFVSNAIKFTPHGEVELFAELIEHTDEQETIRFSVKDTGIGILKENQTHLFQRYRQATADTARMYGGTGLGLSISRRLAEMMGGTVDLISEPGKGSTFRITLTLPIADAPPLALETLHPEVARSAVEPLYSDSAQAPNILAIDDHPINRDLLASQLKLLGLNVETAENGATALALWHTGRFDLIITDCHMPEMDGYVLTRNIREQEQEAGLPRTPVLAWTANALSDEVERCQAAGMDDLLVKPADLVQLRQHLKKWLIDQDTGALSSSSALPDTPVESPPVSPIDHTVLDQIVPSVSDQRAVLDNFRHHIHADMQSLLNSIELENSVDVVQIAHRMKGSSRMVGATELAAVFASIESAAKSSDMNAIRNEMPLLHRALERYDNYLQQRRTAESGQ